MQITFVVEEKKNRLDGGNYAHRKSANSLTLGIDRSPIILYWLLALQQRRAASRLTLMIAQSLMSLYWIPALPQRRAASRLTLMTAQFPMTTWHMLALNRQSLQNGLVGLSRSSYPESTDDSA